MQPDFSSQLLENAIETGLLVNRVRRIPVTGNGLKVPGVDETSRVAGSRFGGIRGYWADEAAEKTASKPKFRMVELTLKKLVGLCYLTDELLGDASALEAWIKSAFADEFGFLLDDSIINGSGSGQPLGILNAAALVTVTKETGQAANTIVFENLAKMWARMPQRNRMNAIWAINQNIEPQLFNLGITVGVGGSPVYLPPGGASASPYSTLFGRPVIAIEQAATLGTAGDIMLLDLNEYLMIDRGAMQSAMSIHVRFIYDESVFRFVYRVDGQPIWSSALTPFKGGAGNTVSPFVNLATRA